MLPDFAAKATARLVAWGGEVEGVLGAWRRLADTGHLLPAALVARLECRGIRPHLLFRLAACRYLNSGL